MALDDEKKMEIKGAADFETAIAATRFGLFNVLLLVICIPGAYTIQFESTLTSYIIPAASCDLELDATSKGLLNSMPFFGMVTSGLIWGFLLDTFGRKRVLLLGFCAEFLIILGKSFSPNVALLSSFKFFAGSLTGGIYVALTTYVLEFHSTQYRGKIQMVFGMMYASANLIIPLISSSILPMKFKLSLYFIEFHAWNLLILISSINALAFLTAFFHFPESPKFLMSTGKNEEALEIFRKIYSMNTRNKKEDYPIKCLLEEIDNKEESASSKKSWKQYLNTGLRQIRPLFGKNYRVKLLVVCMVQGIFLMGLNTLRLYMPQIFQATHEYQVEHNGTSSSLCGILDILRTPSIRLEEVICTVNLENNFRVYMNSAIISSGVFTSYLVVGTLINIFGKKLLLGILGISASVAVICMYYSLNTTTTLALSTLFLAASGVSFDIFVTVIVVLFPTTLRAMAVSISMLMGRLLTVIGNMILPLLVEAGCAPPFLFLGCFSLIAVLLTCAIPNTDKEDMK